LDDFQRWLVASLQTKLWALLSVAIVAAACASGAFSFWSAYREANEFQDDELRQIASLASSRLIDSNPSLPSFAESDPREDRQVIVQRLQSTARPHVGDNGWAPLPLPADLPDGIQTVRVRDEDYRVAVRTTQDGERLVAAQEVEIRDRVARDAAWRSVLPLLLLLPLLLILVSRLIGRTFRPVEALARQVDRRAEHDFDPLDDTGLPRELRPFIVAINRLLVRVVRSVKAEQRFVADAAHELRSPLTALSLQAERFDDLELPALARERLGIVRQSIGRMRHLLEQLLTLARVQVNPVQECTGAVSVHAVFRHVLEDVMPLAQAKSIDLGVDSVDDIWVRMEELDLRAVVRNLTDNAIRYSPPGGRVDLCASVDAGRAAIEVCDRGPGIPESERARVFDPFYRILGTQASGSGLGLAIVRAVADRVGADIALSFQDEARRQGLRVSFKVAGALVVLDQAVTCRELPGL